MTGGLRLCAAAVLVATTMLCASIILPITPPEEFAAAISIGDKDNVTVYDLDGDGRALVVATPA